MNEKRRFQTTLDKSNINALRHVATTNDCKPNDLLNEALEQFLENVMIKVKVWLPIPFVYFLNRYDIMLEKVIRKPLIATVRAAMKEGKISADEADNLIGLLGFQKDEI